MNFKSGLIILDRDGVLNETLWVGGLPDSPMGPEDVQIIPEASVALSNLTQKGWLCVVATNQPAAAKGKTSYERLQQAHDKVILDVQNLGGRIEKSYICWHRREDLCECRKPRPGMLLQAQRDFPDHREYWMVGDRVVDMQAGFSAGMKLALVGPRALELKKELQELSIEPLFFGKNLLEFSQYLENP